MDHRLLLPIALVFALIIIAGGVSAFFSGSKNAYPYEAYDSILTAAERSFFGVLRQCVDAEFVLFTKVRLADVIRIQRGVSAKQRTQAFNRICAKHVDFVICEAVSLRVVSIVELDDKSHREKSRRERDQFLDAALAVAGIAILHVPAQRTYSKPELGDQLKAILSKGLREPVGQRS